MLPSLLFILLSVQALRKPLELKFRYTVVMAVLFPSHTITC